MRAWLGLTALAVVGCVGDSSSTNDGGTDAASDTTVADVGADAPAEAGADVDAAPPTVYNDMTNGSNWIAYDVTQADSTLGAWAGAAVAGQYVYFSPFYTGSAWSSVLGRYDMKGAGFNQPTAWTPYDLGKYNASASGMNGALYDGNRYVYFFPYRNPNYSGVWMRVDTQGNLGDTSAYKFYDLVANVDANALGFGYGAFDGRFIYFTPYYGAVGVRYDTQAAFDVAGSYKKVDLTSLTGANAGFGPVASDGKFLYYGRYGVGTGNSTQIYRYDLSLPYDQVSSFTMIDVKTAGISNVANGFLGGVFDGKYVYFTGGNSTILRFDSTGTFSNAGAWNAYDTTSVDAKTTGGFNCSSFDGRYLYFATYAGTTSAVIIRFDSKGSFGDKNAWQSFDVSTLSGASSARSFNGMAFDGQYLYLVASPKITARFNAKTPPSIPARPLGSFY